MTTSLRFGPFELSSESGELRKNGVRLKLSGQAIQVLLLLTEHPGRVVSREELQKKLWPGDSYGDFEHGLNAAVNRLREALSDSAEVPRFIETLPRRGYRFTASVESKPAQTGAEQGLRGDSAPTDSSAERHFMRSTKRVLIATAILVVLACGIAYWEWIRRAGDGDERDRHMEVTVTPFTTLKGQEISPAFSPDGVHRDA